MNTKPNAEPFFSAIEPPGAMKALVLAPSAIGFPFREKWTVIQAKPPDSFRELSKEPRGEKFHETQPKGMVPADSSYSKQSIGETPAVTLQRYGQAVNGLTATATGQANGTLNLTFSGNAGSDVPVDFTIANGNPQYATTTYRQSSF